MNRFVIPGWCEAPDPESRGSGFDAPHRPGTTDSNRGGALAVRTLSLVATEATMITTAISAITSVQIALISGFTPSRTSE